MVHLIYCIICNDSIALRYFVISQFIFINANFLLLVDFDVQLYEQHSNKSNYKMFANII